LVVREVCIGRAIKTVSRELVRYKLELVGVQEVRLIKMCLNETYIEVRIGKHLSDSFPIQNGLKQGDALSSLLLTLL
jgi:hypothetical protein